MDPIVSLCRRRGFIFQSSELYGGINGFWDYGPLGAELKRNLKEAWWQDVVRCPAPGPDGRPIEIVPVDATIIMNPKVWEASGHVGGFSDLMSTCRHCKKLVRYDHIEEMIHESDWYALLSELYREKVTVADVLGWRKKLSKLAPGLALVRSPKETIRSLITDPQTNEITPPEKMSIDPSGTEIAELIGHLASTQSVWSESPPCPFCGGEITEPRPFNLMFKTTTGAVEDPSSVTYLRPETAQGIFTQFWNVLDTNRVRVPFGIAQVGKAFRNEVTPRNFTFRSREFEQMEIEFFIHPEEAAEWYQYWRDTRFRWWQSIGLAGENLTLREHDQDELAHYAKEGAGTSDVEYRFPFTAPGYGELEGVAHRADYDLRQHATHCGQGDKLRYFDDQRNERYFPHVIEPSAGADRGTLAALCEAYTPDENRPSKVYMKFHPRLAPIKAAVFPLVNKSGMPEVAEKLYQELRPKYAVQFDVKQNIGKRYARMDEAGTPYCFTIDGDTLEDQTVTVRYRDTLEQERIGIDKVSAFLDEKMGK
jgi:glycyl-tRNA synthetase